MNVPNRKSLDFNKDELLEKIMIEHGNDVLYLAFSYVKNRSTAEDLAQEVFMSVYTHLDGFLFEASIKTWLYRITVNRCKDYLKSWSYKTTVVTNVIELALGTSKEKETVKILIEKDEKARLVEIIFSLPLKYREVIYLFYFEEISLNEISGLLNVNINTLKSRMKKAKDLLKKEMEKGGI